MTRNSSGAVSVAQWISKAARRLRRARVFFGHGTQNAEEESAWMLARACRVMPRRLSGLMGHAITPAERQRADDWLNQRIDTRIPLAYLLREAWLGNHRFYVDERVIVPRSFIAELLEEELAPWVTGPEQVRAALDMCTGSGCLAILMAKIFPLAVIDAVDLSADALLVAARNVRRHRLDRRIHLLQSDLFHRLSVRDARYDLIVANPPYVDALAMKALPAEYRHEPDSALAGGKDGLSIISRIMEQSKRYLSPHGFLIMEIGHNREALERAWPRTAFTWLETSAGDAFVFLLTREQLAGEKRRRKNQA